MNLWAGEGFRAAATRPAAEIVELLSGLAEFIAENVLTVPSDAEALAVFSGSG
jgi:hypothetical protein